MPQPASADIACPRGSRPCHAAATAQQVLELASAGSELVRVTVNVSEAAKAVPEIRQRLLAENFDIIGSTPDEFGAMVKREVEKYRKIILESGMPRL